MPTDRNDSHAARPPRKMGWIIGGVLVLLLVILALNGVFRGIGEATGVTDAAPGDDNASPAAESGGKQDQ